MLFVSRTNLPEDLEYLQELLETSNRYKSIDLNEGRTEDYSKPWEKLEEGPMYIKIDDDVVSTEFGTWDVLWISKDRCRFSSKTVRLGPWSPP